MTPPPRPSTVMGSGEGASRFGYEGKMRVKGVLGYGDVVEMEGCRLMLAPLEGRIWTREGTTSQSKRRKNPAEGNKPTEPRCCQE